MSANVEMATVFHKFIKHKSFSFQIPANKTEVKRRMGKSRQPLLVIPISFNNMIRV